MIDPTMSILTFQLPSGDGWLHATLNLPTQPQARAAVLVCPPLVEERKASQRAMVDGARHLAETAACVVLRIDYRGCGDSSGTFETTGVDDWRADIETAAAWLRQTFSALPQIRLGIRAGALLAGSSGAGDTAALIFWEPVAGDAFIRQLLQRRMVNDMIAYGRARTSRTAIEETLRSGGRVDLDGYTVTAAQVAGLAACPLPATRLPGLAILTGGDPRVRSTLGEQSPSLDLATLRLAPFWNSVGHVDTQPLADASGAWICGHFVDLLPLPTTVLPPAPAETTEAPVVIPVPQGELRAILHRPPAGPPREAFLFLGGWSGDRQGPHRLFLLFARRLAAEGNLALRLDYRGRGESDGTVADAGIGSMVDDATAGVRWLQEHLPAGTPISLIAICSGCKVAIGTTVRQPGIHRLVLWSAEVMGSLHAGNTNLRKTLGALRAYGKKLVRRETWKKILTGNVRAGMVGKALARHETRSADEARREDKWLSQFRQYRGGIRFVYGASDPAAAPAAAAYTRYCTRHGIPFELDTIAHAGHSFYGAGWRNELLARTTAWLNSQSANAAPVSRPSK
jgi:alpha/beta superfamily hydrolase